MLITFRTSTRRLVGAALVAAGLEETTRDAITEKKFNRAKAKEQAPIWVNVVSLSRDRGPFREIRIKNGSLESLPYNKKQ